MSVIFISKAIDRGPRYMTIFGFSFFTLGFVPYQVGINNWFTVSLMALGAALIAGSIVAVTWDLTTWCWQSFCIWNEARETQSSLKRRQNGVYKNGEPAITIRHMRVLIEEHRKLALSFTHRRSLRTYAIRKFKLIENDYESVIADLAARVAKPKLVRHIENETFPLKAANEMTLAQLLGNTKPIVPNR